jgi:hypothetical protein
MQNLDNGKNEDFTLGFYKGIIHAMQLDYPMKIIVDSAMHEALQNGMNLRSIEIKAMSYLEENVSRVQKSGIKSGLIIPMEMILMRIDDPNFLKQESYNIWSVFKEEDMSSDLKMIYNSLSSGGMPVTNESLELANIITNDIFVSIAILMKLKKLKDDNKNGFMTYDYDFAEQQINEISELRREINC